MDLGVDCFEAAGHRKQRNRQDLVSITCNSGVWFAGTHFTSSFRHLWCGLSFFVRRETRPRLHVQDDSTVGVRRECERVDGGWWTVLSGLSGLFWCEKLHEKIDAQMLVASARGRGLGLWGNQETHQIDAQSKRDSGGLSLQTLEIAVLQLVAGLPVILVFEPIPTTI